MCQIELWDMAGIPINNLWSAGWKKLVRGTLDRAFSGVNERRCTRAVSEGHTDITQVAMRRIRARTVAFHDERLATHAAAAERTNGSTTTRLNKQAR
jgi:hypothetical protein